MSLAVAVYVPEGIVLASDSRESLSLEGKTPDGHPLSIDTVNSDNATTTFLLQQQQVGVSIFGQDLHKGQPAASHMKRFSEEQLNENDNVEMVASKLVKYFRDLSGTVDVGFIVCGYQKQDGMSVPFVFACQAGKQILEHRNVTPERTITFGAIWSGQTDIIADLVNPVVVDALGTKQVVQQPAPIVWEAMPLQDAIDFAIFAIRTTIDMMHFQARLKTVGGPIDVLVLTSDGPRWIQQKQLHGGGFAP